MRFFIALLLTVAIDAVKTLIWICLFGVLTWQAISTGVLLALSVLGSAAVTGVVVWLVERRLHLSRRYRDLVFSIFGYGPAPSHPLASTIAGQSHARFAAFAYAVAVTIVLTFLVIVPIAIFVASHSRLELEQAFRMVIWLAFLLGSSTVLALGNIAYSRARSELVVSSGSSGGRDDQPGLSERLRKRWRSEIEADQDKRS